MNNRVPSFFWKSLPPFWFLPSQIFFQVLPSLKFSKLRSPSFERGETLCEQRLLLLSIYPELSIWKRYHRTLRCVFKLILKVMGIILESGHFRSAMILDGTSEEKSLIWRSPTGLLTTIFFTSATWFDAKAKALWTAPFLDICNIIRRLKNCRIVSNYAEYCRIFLNNVE